MWESLVLAVCFFCLTPPPHFSHYSSGLRFYNSTFTKNFMPDPHRSHKASEVWWEPLGQRASPPRPTRHSHASRTQRSSAKHNEHHQHSEQAEFSTILKGLSKFTPGFLWPWLWVRGIPFHGLLFCFFKFWGCLFWVFFWLLLGFLFWFLGGFFACFCFPGVLSVWNLVIFSSYCQGLLCEQQ